MWRGPRLVAVSIMASSALLLAACGGGGSAPSGPQLSGTVAIDGSSTVAPLAQAAGELFKKEQPNVNVTVGTSGTGGGFQKFCNGETDIATASRKIKTEEQAKCDAKGIKSAELQVANDALTVVVNKSNTWATCLTVDQLKKIWAPGSTVKAWNEVDPSFPAEPLALFGPGADSGTFEYFTEAINGKAKESRKDYSPSENDNVIVQGVSGSKGAMGYFGYTYFEENQDKLKALQINSGAGCVSPSAATVQDGTYKPLSRPLFVYPASTGVKKPQVAAFVQYFLDKDDQITKAAKFVPATAEQKKKSLDTYSQFKSSSGA